jgi:hypothetical protein
MPYWVVDLRTKPSCECDPFQQNFAVLLSSWGAGAFSVTFPWLKDDRQMWDNRQAAAPPRPGLDARLL